MTHTAIAQRMDRELMDQEFDRLVERHYQHAYNLAYRLTGNAADAEDLVQEAFLRAYRFFDRYDPTMPFINWFNQILTNLFIDEHRRRKRLPTLSLEERFENEEGEESEQLDIADTSPSPLEIAEANQYLDAIEEGLSRLSPEFRAAVVLADVMGHSYEEIAEMMNTSIGTVRSRIHRGRKQLRDIIQRHHPELFERGDLK